MNILTALKDLTDPRREQPKKYEMSEILYSTIIALLCDANSYRDVATFIFNNFQLLKDEKILSCNQSPAYTTIRNIILLVDKKELANLVTTYFLEILCSIDTMHLSIDGKSMRGSYDRKKKTSAAHILSVFEVELGVTVGFENVRDKKTNEIPIAQQVLSETPITGVVFSMDALHCQEKTVDICLANGNDLLVQVKRNQKTILGSCQIRSRIAKNYEIHETSDNAHGRKEQRKTVVYEGIPNYVNNWSQKFEVVIRVDRTQENCITGRKSFDESYYLCTKKLTAKDASKLVRDHWGIENRQNYVLDETFGEDRSRIRVKPEIFSLLRIIALNVLRLNKIRNIRNTRKGFGYNTASVFELNYL